MDVELQQETDQNYGENQIESIDMETTTHPGVSVVKNQILIVDIRSGWTYMFTRATKDSKFKFMKKTRPTGKEGIDTRVPNDVMEQLSQGTDLEFVDSVY